MTPLVIPHNGPRIETGTPIQFGDDWPGVFIRGDDCARLMMSLKHADDPLMLMQAKGFVSSLENFDVLNHSKGNA